MYTRALKESPQDINIRCNRVLAYSKCGMYSKALQDCEKILELEGNHTKTYFWRAKILQKMGDYTVEETEQRHLLEFALSNYKQALRRLPYSKEIRSAAIALNERLRPKAYRGFLKPDNPHGFSFSRPTSTSAPNTPPGSLTKSPSKLHHKEEIKKSSGTSSENEADCDTSAIQPQEEKVEQHENAEEHKENAEEDMEKYGYDDAVEQPQGLNDVVLDYSHPHIPKFVEEMLMETMRLVLVNHSKVETHCYLYHPGGDSDFTYVKIKGCFENERSTLECNRYLAAVREKSHAIAAATIVSSSNLRFPPACGDVARRLSGLFIQLEWPEGLRVFFVPSKELQLQIDESLKNMTASLNDTDVQDESVTELPEAFRKDNGDSGEGKGEGSMSEADSDDGKGRAIELDADTYKLNKLWPNTPS